MSEGFIRAVRRCLHPDAHIPSPERPPPSRRQPSTVAATNSEVTSSQNVNVDTQRTTSTTTGHKRNVPTLSSQTQSQTQTVDDDDENVAGSSSQQQSKRRKKVKVTSSKALRGAVYRSKPSQAVLDRYTRSLRHRLFLIERNNPVHNGDGDGDGEMISETFAVMGANGNVYTCKISTQSECNCPDFIKRNGNGPCKHLLFIFTRVLKLKEEDPIWWQSKLLPDEVSRILKEAPRNNNATDDVLANEGVRSMYRVLQQRDKNNQQEKDSSRRPIEGDCPICFENLKAADPTRPDDVTTFCESCGHNFHKSCVQNWVRARSQGQSQASCPLCRANMNNIQGTTQISAAATRQQYTNLSTFSTDHARNMTLAELYADTHQYIGRQSYAGGRGRGRGR